MEKSPDREVESHLRQGAGREWLEEAAEDEKLTELLRRRRLDLSGRILELVHRGERVRAEAGAHTFSGRVVYAGADFASIDRGDDLVEVVLDSAVWTVERSESGGSEQSGDKLTLRARLAEIAAATESVRILVIDGRAIVGSIDVVATDHVEVFQDGSTIVIPIRQIIAVIRPTSRF
jgi:hypothetical protein